VEENGAGFEQSCNAQAAGRKVEQTAAGAATGTTVYAPLDKTPHHRSVADLETKPAWTRGVPGVQSKAAASARRRAKTGPGGVKPPGQSVSTH